jgi:hypothetical protein
LVFTISAAILTVNCIVGGTGVALALHEASLVTAAAMAVGVLAGPLTTPCRIGRPMAGKP